MPRRPPAPRWRRRAPPLLLLLLALAAGRVPAAPPADAEGLADEACPADAEEAGVCRSGGGAAGQPRAAAAGRPAAAAPAPSKRAAVPARRATLLEQELEEVRALAALYRERIALLKELQAALSSDQGLLARLPDTHVRALKEPLPPISETAGTEEGTPASATSDFLVLKALVPLEEEVDVIKFLPLRNPRSTTPTPIGQVQLPAALLIAAQMQTGALRFFTPSGELVASHSAGHDAPLAHLAVSPLHDEYIFVTCDTLGVVRVHKVSVRQRRVTREEREARKVAALDKTSMHFGSQLNVTVTFSRRFEMVNDTEGTRPAVTAIALASQQGTKYFLLGDDRGVVTMFTRNGTLHAELPTGLNSTIENLHVYLSTVLFLSRGSWGFVDMEKPEVRHGECFRFPGEVHSMVVDQQHPSRLLVADTAGDVWVFNIENRRKCRIEHRFPQGATRPPIELTSIRGFTLALGPAATGRTAGDASSPPMMALTAFNNSHVGKKRLDPARSTPAVIWRRLAPVHRSWTLHRRYQQGELVAFLSDDGLEVEIYELIMHTYSQPIGGDNFGNFKLPVFAVAIVLVLGFQYVKGKGAFDPGLVGGDG